MGGRRGGVSVRPAQASLLLDARKNKRIWVALALLGLVCVFAPLPATSQERREREPNSVYAARRAKLAAEVDAPVVLWGFTGREEASQAYVFAQEENFYYLTGHNEEGAALVILPAHPKDASKKNDAAILPRWGAALLRPYKAENENGDGARESLYLPAKNPQKEKWNGVRMAPTDPGIEARTGFASVKPVAELRATMETLAKSYADFYTILPYEKELGGYPHEKQVTDWLQLAAPQTKLKD